MSNQITPKKYLLSIPTRIEVRLLEDGSFVSEYQTEIERIFEEKQLYFLEADIELGKSTGMYMIHEYFKHKISAYIRRELFPVEPADSPIHYPGTWTEITIEGNITTWKRTPYQTASLAN
jgi:hypothetical protein